MKFLTDGMLGKLTRWLRLLGYDVEYFNDAEDEKLMQEAKQENRVLLTRDYQLFRRASIHGIESFYVEGRTETERLAEMSRRFNIRLDVDVKQSRCTKCNALIITVAKEAVKDRIPESTFRFYNDFWICPNCKQIYWQGSHWEKIERTLILAKRIAESLSSI